MIVSKVAKIALKIRFKLKRFSHKISKPAAQVATHLSPPFLSLALSHSRSRSPPLSLYLSLSLGGQAAEPTLSLSPSLSLSLSTSLSTSLSRYKGTSLIRDRTPLGPYSRPNPGVLWRS